MKNIKKMALVQLAILAIAVICLFSVIINNNQAVMATPMPLSFAGEYSRDGENWHTYDDRTTVSALDGELFLRGHFDRDIPQNTVINFLNDHIATTVYVDGERVYVDAIKEMEELGMGKPPSACARKWGGWWFPEGLSSEAKVEIHFQNPHIYGNPNAYHDLLHTLCGTPAASNLLELTLEPYAHPFRTVGFILLVIAILLIGAAIAAAIMQLPAASLLWKCGFLAVFAGGFMLLDVIDISLSQNLYAVNTYGRQLCMMLFPLWLGFCMLDCLTGKKRNVALTAILLSAGTDGLLMLLPLTGAGLLYDMLPWWAASQLVVSPLLAICCVMEWMHADKKRKPLLASIFLLLLMVLLDLFGVGANILSTANCTKAAFVLLLLVHVAGLLRFSILNYQASILAKKLKKELEESRIAIMLSQIQPHFLYNTLSTIRELCHIDPLAAENAVIKFSEFLRKNMDSLSIDKPIPFESELMHTKNYLELEQLRFGDQLVVELDIQATGFKLPTLTLQPIVENAVRHGARKNQDIGKVFIGTSELDDRFEILIRDNGPGFTEKVVWEDGKTHIGIKNVRERLFKMCGGTLEITSAQGEGTTARIILQKNME